MFDSSGDPDPIRIRLQYIRDSVDELACGDSHGVWSLFHWEPAKALGRRLR
jgi:hypothetical protein